MASAENPTGLSYYFRTLPDGSEQSCGIRIELEQAPPKEVYRIITSQNTGPVQIALVFNGDQPPVEYSHEDLGDSPKERQQVLEGVAKMATQWGNTVIIMKGTPKRNASNRPRQS